MNQYCRIGNSYPSPLACDFEITDKLCSDDPLNFGTASICTVCGKSD